MNGPIRLELYDGDVFRVFSTAYPSQELMDDLVDMIEEQATLKPLYYSDPEPSEMDRLERVLQRSFAQIIQDEISEKFNPQNWYASRYSDGTWGVLYTAESRQTAQAESLHHKRRFMAEEIAQTPVTIDLRIAQLNIVSKKCVHVCADHSLERSKLISIDESGYSYCQAHARRCRRAGAELLKTPSARDSDGICVPIFDRQAIKQDYGHLDYIKCVLSKDQTDVFAQHP